MAKFLPFVNKDTPIYEIADKICSRYSGCNLATKLQFLNIIASEGLEKVEKAVKELDEDSHKSELVVIREFSHVPPIPSNTLLVAKYFIEYANRVCPPGTYWNTRHVDDDAVVLCLALSLFNIPSLVPCKNASLPTFFTEKLHHKNVASKKLFSSSVAAEVREFSCPEDLEAYLLLAYAEPEKMFETLDPQKGFIFTKPVRAVLKSE